MEGEQFRVDRRVFVDMSKVRTVKKGLKGAEPNTIQLVQGNEHCSSLLCSILIMIALNVFL